MKYAIVTFGCRVNQADSLEVEQELIAAGAQPSAAEEADLVVVNTCSVTASADQGARQTIRRIGRVNQGARIVVTGCYASRRPDDVGALPGVVAVVPNSDKDMFVSGLRHTLPLMRTGDDDTLPELSTADRFGDGEGSCGATIEPGVAGRTALTLRVQTGCDEPCSYCIIPSTRGRGRSRPVADVIAQVARAADAGFKEVTLTGVHLGSFGRDFDPPVTLSTLLETLGAWAQARAEGTPVLFRISSLEPMDCTDDVVRLVAERRCFAPHFHLPLQHASNAVLARMRRPYTIEQYSALVDSIRAAIPEAAIGSDVIVGFPGETDQDFDRLVAYLARSPLTHVHVFPYSDRPGTAAAAMKDKVPGNEVRERARRVRDISNELARRFRAAQVGATYRALTIEDGSLAVTGNYLKLRIPAGRVRNEWVEVRVIADGRGEPAEARPAG